MQFKANYFDGKSSRTYKATIIPSSANWNISYTDDTLELKTTIWKTSEIQKSEVYTKGLISFKYGNKFPFQKIESTDEKFIEYISNSEHKNLNNKVDNWLHKSALKSITLLLLTIVGFALGMYFYVVPAVAVSFAKNLPKESVIDFGNYVFRTISYDLDIDEKQSKNLQNFVDKMQLNNEFPLVVYVANSNQLNAFAISGGKFVIFSGLLEEIETEHQLAALIGHEVSHIENRHVLKNVARSLSGAIFMSVLFGDVSGATAILGENAHGLLQLSHSRALEEEADIFGLKVMKDNNLDQHGMPELFEILKENSKIDVPTFLSSHPMLEDRIEYAKKVADKQGNFKENHELKKQWKIINDSFNSGEKSENQINIKK